jgi:hypothetical protein
MLSKQIGPSTVLTMSATTQTFIPTTTLTGVSNGKINQTLPATKVRIATGAQPAYIGFNTTATLTTTGILIPANTVEHFKLDLSSVVTTGTTATNYLNTTVITPVYVSVLQAGTAGSISITPVA